MASEQGHTAGELALRRFEPHRVHIGQAGNLDTVHDGQIVVHAFGDFEDDMVLAERIVRAVNCHDDLVKALERLIHPDGGEEDDIRAARAALTKAQS